MPLAPFARMNNNGSTGQPANGKRKSRSRTWTPFFNRRSDDRLDARDKPRQLVGDTAQRPRGALVERVGRQQREEHAVLAPDLDHLGVVDPAVLAPGDRLGEGAAREAPLPLHGGPDLQAALGPLEIDAEDLTDGRPGLLDEVLGPAAA